MQRSSSIKSVLNTKSGFNATRGTVVSIEQGAVNGIVQIEVAPGLIISSSITNEAIRDLGLEVGGEAVALIKASSVMVGVQD